MVKKLTFSSAGLQQCPIDYFFVTLFIVRRLHFVFLFFFFIFGSEGDRSSVPSYPNHSWKAGGTTLQGISIQLPLRDLRFFFFF